MTSQDCLQRVETLLLHDATPVVLVLDGKWLGVLAEECPDVWLMSEAPPLTIAAIKSNRMFLRDAFTAPLYSWRWGEAEPTVEPHPDLELLPEPGIYLYRD